MGTQENNKRRHPHKSLQCSKATCAAVQLWDMGGNRGVIEKLEVFHRRQLREVLGVKTKDLHNVDLYEQCGVSPVKHHVAWAKWSLFGNTLRMARDTPAQVAKDFYCQSSESDVKSMGRAITTLP